jgi:hypothetical protein
VAWINTAVYRRAHADHGRLTMDQREREGALDSVDAQITRIRCALEAHDFAPDDRVKLTRVLVILGDMRAELLRLVDQRTTR